MGVIDQNKNIGLIIRAMNLLKKDGWNIELEVIGTMKDKKVYNSIIRAPNVTVIEKLPKEQLIDHYRDAHIFVMPSHNESFGLVYAEAMSQGLPVIYTRGQGFDGQFPEGEVGYSVSDIAPEEIAEKIGLIIERYQKVSKSCIEKANKFDWNLICETYSSIYETVIRERAIGNDN